ncbi:morn repeat-containing protein 3 [Holotrichia oblita]|uniref:Morn repeat-containing protein 3 n=1 Tax=Holotrichia oblita TaxID=644536 RepID=A0ACB9T620_HOLOL|nr:morn repeat-containing protein 3 [Holotrichia oblita]
MPFLKGKSILESRCRNLENASMKNGLRHGVFTPDRDKYLGEWEDNIKAGKGYELSRSGKLYEGDWERGFRHGFGVQSLRNDNNIFNVQYRGEWRNGNPHGYGAWHYPDGSYYLGHWRNGKRHGHGQMWYTDGSFYDGSWIKDLREQLGMFVSPDGNRYEGEWSKDQKHGKGRYFHLDSGQMQEGVWIKGNCSYSTIIDIPFRQTAVKATPYPIQSIEVADPVGLCKHRISDSVDARMLSSASIRMWV